MQHTDVAIIGGGLAGSMTAAMLGKAGIQATVIEPKTECAREFRCEKLDPAQMKLLEKTGLSGPAFDAMTRITDNWIVRFGKVVEKRRVNHFGFHYDSMVNAIRDQIPTSIPHIPERVVDLSYEDGQSRLKLTNGGEISAKIVVMASGLDNGLQQTIGMEREIRRAGHIMCVGFDLRPAKGNRFDFSSITYWPESTASRMTHLTMFKAGAVYRANAFGYWDQNDLLLRSMRQDPQKVLGELMPKTPEIIGDFDVVGRVNIRPVDLYVAKDFLRPGIVLVGDAYSTSCPGAGTGAYKVFTDVERLCNEHIPNWLQSGKTGEEQMADFYQDPERLASEQYSQYRAEFLRSMSLSNSLPWKVRRWARFAVPVVAGALKLDVDWERFMASRKRSPQRS